MILIHLFKTGCKADQEKIHDIRTWSTADEIILCLHLNRQYPLQQKGILTAPAIIYIGI